MYEINALLLYSTNDLVINLSLVHFSAGALTKESDILDDKLKGRFMSILIIDR